MPSRGTDRRPTGWRTTDAEEVERRRQRGLEVPFRIEPQNLHDAFYGDYRVGSGNGRVYRVEIRSLDRPVNTCGCPDHRINGLGTCKHVEATLARLQKGRKRAFKAAARAGSPVIEIYPDRRDGTFRALWPASEPGRTRAGELVHTCFDERGKLVGEALDAIPALQRAVSGAHPQTRRRIRISSEVNVRLAEMDRREQRLRARRHFEAEVAAGNESLNLVRSPLYPYQQAGMLHLAFTGRALLADEMGLGKTVQGVAACELLRRTEGIRRVLVVSPASLKGEWEEQIAKFTALDSRIVQGPRPQRIRQYRDPAFFSLTSYEQVRSDVNEINKLLEPDVVILDEAQRIKNWQTRTAIAVKRLESPYAFVLTGTPVENRIDEIYSIVQFLDPAIFGPLFRFNREFYELDEKGRAIGYRNLDRLHERLRPVMLRRRKHEVEGQLPGRTVNNFFVPMHREQRLRYSEYEAKVARLSAMARKRPLKKEEMDRLQQMLACMRMLCDTPYILDQECRVAPKLKELHSVFGELMEDGAHKVIVFSEWERMLELARERIAHTVQDLAWHTGSVSQARRRAEIRRFREDPRCRLFLSTDSGSVGLNLQAADVVINLDLPWNPARLEQRIARAWRKHQKRPVQVINLVTENSIEHRMLTLLEQKRSLAAEVVDGDGGKKMPLPSGRSAFLERVDSLFDKPPGRPGPAPVSRDPLEVFAEEVLTCAEDGFERIEMHGEGAKRTVVVVADGVDGALRATLERKLQAQYADRAPGLTVLDRAMDARIRELIEAGVLRKGPDPTTTVQCDSACTATGDDAAKKRLSEARACLEPGRRSERMASVLADGGFPVEALAPMRKAVDSALQALLIWRGRGSDGPASMERIDSVLVRGGMIEPGDVSVIARIRDESSVEDAPGTGELLARCKTLVSRAVSVLASAA